MNGFANETVDFYLMLSLALILRLSKPMNLKRRMKKKWPLSHANAVNAHSAPFNKLLLFTKRLRFLKILDKKGCGQANQETRIVGGKPTGINVRIVLFLLNNCTFKNILCIC